MESTGEGNLLCTVKRSTNLTPTDSTAQSNFRTDRRKLPVGRVSQESSHGRRKQVVRVGECEAVPLGWRRPRSSLLLGTGQRSPFLWQPSGEGEAPGQQVAESIHTLPHTHQTHTSRDPADNTPSLLVPHPDNDLHCFQLQVLLVTV